MQQYLEALKHIRDNGRFIDDERTGVGTTNIFGHQFRFNLLDGFPLLTTKKVFMRGITEELIWIISGDTNEQTLRDKDVNIWAEWADADGSLGRIYGAQWRSWNFINKDGKPDVLDQLSNLIARLKSHPFCRRHIITAWQPGELDQMKLPPCHCFFQFGVDKATRGERIKWLEYQYPGSYESKLQGALEALGSNASKEAIDGVCNPILDQLGIPTLRLSCQLYQRSSDVFLGVPFNIASYSMFTHMVAQCVGMLPGDFIHTFGSFHIYSNHKEQVELQLSRTPRSLPFLRLNPDVKDITKFVADDVSISAYHPYPAIPAPVAI